jgi:hypothetical protein
MRYMPPLLYSTVLYHLQRFFSHRQQPCVPGEVLGSMSPARGSTPVVTKECLGQYPEDPDSYYYYSVQDMTGHARNDRTDKTDSMHSTLAFVVEPSTPSSYR